MGRRGGGAESGRGSMGAQDVGESRGELMHPISGVLPQVSVQGGVQSNVVPGHKVEVSLGEDSWLAWIRGVRKVCGEEERQGGGKGSRCQPEGLGGGVGQGQEERVELLVDQCSVALGYGELCWLPFRNLAGVERRGRRASHGGHD